MIKYLFPDFMDFHRNEIIISLFEKNKNMIRDNVSIYSFYGTFPNAIWNGGTMQFSLYNTSIKEMIKIRDFYYKKGFVITFTFTNSLIKEEHLNDEYCNNILKVFHNGMNEVLVVSPILEKYIRKNYPNYKINRSIINTEDGSLVYDNYNLTVLSKFRNHDFKLLNSLSNEQKLKTELLCAEICINQCPYAYEHYKEYAYLQLYGQTELGKLPNSYAQCRFIEQQYQLLKKRLLGSLYRITYEEIVNIYLPLGFQFFKLSGRGIYNFSTLEICLHYLFKPEYHEDILCYLVETYYTIYRVEAIHNLLNFSELNERIISQNWQYV